MAPPKTRLMLLLLVVVATAAAPVVQGAVNDFPADNLISSVVDIAADPEQVGPTTSLYQGCYADNAARDLKTNVAADPKGPMNPSKCITLCAEKGFNFAGVQFAYECWCGNTYGSVAGSPKCDFPCTGDKSLICGGNSANSVYATSSVGVCDKCTKPPKEGGCKCDQFCNCIKGNGICAAILNSGEVASTNTSFVLGSVDFPRGTEIYAAAGNFFASCSGKLPVGPGGTGKIYTALPFGTASLCAGRFKNFVQGVTPDGFFSVFCY